VNRDTTGKTGATESSTGSPADRGLPLEPLRRKPSAQGRGVRLADGQLWMLAVPTYRGAGPGALTRPCVDQPLDRIFEDTVLDGGMDWRDLWAAARALLLANYALADDELTLLLSVAPGPEARALAAEVAGIIFGPGPGEKTYTQWVRASLLANGLGGVEIPSADLLNVLAVLVATGRTLPLSKFADACLQQDERARLESLV
jgi:hypothetical protein